MAIICWAPDCNHNMKDRCSFYRFPKNMKVFRKWLSLLRRGDARVCSCHFREGKKENNPEIFVQNQAKLFGKHHFSPEMKRVRQRLFMEEFFMASTSSKDADCSTSAEEKMDIRPSSVSASVATNIEKKVRSADIVFRI